MKLSQAIQGFELTKRIDISSDTSVKYAYVLKRLLEFLGDREVEKVTTLDVRLFLDSLRTQHEGGKRRKLSKRSIHDYWAVVSTFWTWAATELEIANVITGKIPAPTYTERVIMPFTQDEVRRIVKTTGQGKEWETKSGKVTRSERATGQRDKAIVVTLVDSGLRASELCSLTLADYDSERGRIHVKHGKGDKERYVMVGIRTQKAIWRYMTTRQGAKPTSPLFSTRDGRFINRSNLHHMLAKIGHNAGVPNTHPHRFRHTFAVEFLRSGGNVLVLKELLGHEKLEQTMRYVKFLQSDIEGSAKHSPSDRWNL